MKRRSGYITRVICYCTAITGFFVLAGWLFDIPFLTSLSPGIISMKFNTAICFILAAFSLYMLDTPEPGPARKKMAYGFALLILLAGFLNLLEYLLHWNAGIDELLWKEGKGTVGTQYPGRMSPITAVNFSVLGFVLLNLSQQERHKIIQAFLFLLLPGPLFVTFNYLIGNSFLNYLPQLNTMALHTAILFLLLSIGVFCSSPLQYIRFSFREKIAFFFTLILFITGTIFFAFQKSREQVTDTAQWVEHTREVLAEAEQVTALVNEIQSDTRGYIITGKDQYLPLLGHKVRVFDSIINRLRVLTNDNRIQQQRIDTLQKLWSAYISSREQLIAIRSNSGFEAAQTSFLTGEGNRADERVRYVVTAIAAEENRLLQMRTGENEQSIRNSYHISLILLAVIVLLLLLAMLIIFNNIQARDKTEKQLKESEEKLSILFNSIDEGFCIIEILFDTNKKPDDYRFLVINPSFEKQTGLKNAIGKRMRELAPNHEEHWFEIYGNIALTGESIRFQNKAEQLGRWYDVYAFRFGDPENKQVAILFNDITERKKTEETKLQLSRELEKQVEEKTREAIEKEQQYRFLLQNMREGIQVISHDWKYIFVNKAVIKQSKYSNEELLGYTMMEKYPGIEGTDLFRVMQTCVKEKIPRIIENEFTFPDGTKEWYELSIQPVPEGLFILSMDITQRKIAEELLVASESRFRSIIEQFPYPVVTYAPDGTFLNANKAWEHMWQDKRENIKGYNIRKDPQLAVAGLSALIEKAFSGEVVLSDPYLYDPELAGQTGRKRWMQMTLYPLKDTGGDILEVILVLQDVTKNKEAEEQLKRYAEELRISNSELERFAYVASHDLQEPLRMVSSFLNLLEEEFKPGLSENAREYIHYAVDGAGRMKILVNDLLQYSRIGSREEEFTTHDLNETIEYVTRVLAEDIKKNKAAINVKTLPVITVNKTLISQLFMNLLSNALKYRGDKPPEIEIGCTDGPTHYTFYVKDNGIGIDPKFFDKIFIIFQRLHNKKEYAGTGIGLAICKKIVETHKGKIWVESAEGQGSIFYFTILKYRS